MESKFNLWKECKSKLWINECSKIVQVLCKLQMYLRTMILKEDINVGDKLLYSDSVYKVKSINKHE